MSDEGSEGWYPSVVVKLTLRFDEAFHVAAPKGETSLDAVLAQTPEALATGRTSASGVSGGNSVGGAALTQFGDPVNNAAGRGRPRTALDEARRAQNQALASLDQRLPSDAVTPGVGVIGQRGAGTLPNSEVEPLTFGTDGFTVIANRVPKKGTFTIPHPRQAPTFSLTFDYTEFPVNPQLIRAVGVEIHVGAVDAEDFARGMLGEVDSDGRPLSILKTTDDIVDPITGRKQPNQGTLLFYGTVDTWDVDHGDKDSTIVMEGREIRAILIDTKVVPAHVDKIKLNQPITEVVGDLIGSIRFDEAFRLMAATDATEWPDGIVPSPGDADGLTSVRQKAATRPGAKAQDAHGHEEGVQTGAEATRSTPENGSKGSYWDLITNYCELVGAMPHVVGSILWIRPVHRIFDIVDPNSKIPTPFAGSRPRTVGRDGEQIRVRRLVLGRDLARLRIQRKFGGVAVVPTVQCISFDDKGVGRQRLISGQWPPSGSGAAETKAEQELLRVPMWGVRSVERLNQIARGIYEEIGRGEIGGTAETERLASFGGDNADPDLMRIRTLEPIELVVDASTVRTAMPISSDINELERMTFSQEVDEMTRTIGDRAVARALVAISRGAVREVLNYYQVVSVTFEWDKGMKTSMQFQNYVIPRNLAKSPADLVPKKDIRIRPVRVVGQGRKAKAKVTVTVHAERIDSPEPTSRPRFDSINRIPGSGFGRNF